jgi:hypothetical protein
MGNSRWVRSKTDPMALREDGIGVSLSEGKWAAVVETKIVRLKTPGLLSYLERAIEEADELFLPGAWTVDASIWKAAGWYVRVGEGGWSVFRPMEGKLVLASKKVFASSDRARSWAESRLDRAEGGLRGPKPRGGKAANAKLPDIRVTEDERALADRVLEREGLSYSEFVRACFAWVGAHPGESPWLLGVKEPLT